MTWFKVDGSFHDHPKFWNASEYAVCLWVRAGSWSAKQLTDGFVPDGMIQRWTRNADVAAQELVDNGSWKRVEGGFQFHDWDQFNPSKEKVLRLRERGAERQARYRERSKGNGVTNGVTSRRYSHSDSRVSNGASNEGPKSPLRGDSYAPPRAGAREASRPSGVDREAAKVAAENHLPVIRELLAKKRPPGESTDAT
jgi:hypothetical protein